MVIKNRCHFAKQQITDNNQVKRDSSLCTSTQIKEFVEIFAILQEKVAIFIII